MSAFHIFTSGQVIDGHIPVSHYHNLCEAMRWHSYTNGTANFHKSEVLAAMETEWKHGILLNPNYLFKNIYTSYFNKNSHLRMADPAAAYNRKALNLNRKKSGDVC